MKSMLEELKDVKIKKHTVTSIEYDCKSEKNRYRELYSNESWTKYL